MKVIDAMIKISRGEKVSFEILNDENHIYHSTNGSFLYDETSKQEVYWCIDENWLNKEIKIIEEDKKIKKLDLDWVEVFNFKEQAQQDCVKMVFNKINEIIKAINEMREDK